MTTTINNSYSAIVPAVYGTATPVIDVGYGAGSADAVVALTRAGSVVVNLGHAPPGAVTYTVSGLAHEMSSSSVAAPVPVQSSAQSSTEKSADVPAQTDRQPAPIITGSDAGDGVYDGSGVFTPTMNISVNTVLGSGVAPGGAGSGSAVGSLVSTAV